MIRLINTQVIKHFDKLQKFLDNFRFTDFQESIDK